MYLQFAWRYFKAKKTVNAINIIAAITTSVVAFATCCQLLVLSVFNGFEGLVQSLYSSFYADVRIVPTKGKTFTITSQQIQLLQKQPSIAGISNIVQDKALLQNGEQQTVVTLKGVDSNYQHISGVVDKITNGNFDLGNADEPKMVVGYGVQDAAAINLSAAFAASQLTVILPKKTASTDVANAMSEGIITAAGVFTIQQEIDNQFALTNLAFVQQQMGVEPNQLSAIEIKLKPKITPEKAKMALQALLPASLTVQTRYEQNANLYSTMRLEKWAIYAILTLIIIIASFTMVSALTMLVLEKQKDISILRSMGASAASIQKIFLTEGLLLGFIGAACGVALALIICLLQMQFHIVKIGGGSFLIDYFPVKLIATDFLIVAGTAILIALLASWFPAAKAARQGITLK